MTWKNECASSFVPQATATEINVVAALEMQRISRDWGCIAHVHVSTAYVNSDRVLPNQKFVREKIYGLDFDAEAVVRDIQSNFGPGSGNARNMFALEAFQVRRKERGGGLLTSAVRIGCVRACVRSCFAFLFMPLFDARLLLCAMLSKAKIMGNFPNTYTLTKSMAENLLAKFVVFQSCQ